MTRQLHYVNCWEYLHVTNIQQILYDYEVVLEIAGHLRMRCTLPTPFP